MFKPGRQNHPRSQSNCLVPLMKPLKLYHVVTCVVTCVIYLVLVATTENQDHQSTEAQHGELEEIHCASSLGGESSYIAAFQYINSPNQVL